MFPVGSASAQYQYTPTLVNPGQYGGAGGSPGQYGGSGYPGQYGGAGGYPGQYGGGDTSSYGSGNYGGYGGAGGFPGTSPFGAGALGRTRVRNSRTGTYGDTSASPDQGMMGGRGSRRNRATPTPASTAAGQGPASTRGKGPATTVMGVTPAPARAGMAQGPQTSASFGYRPSPDVAILYITPFQASVAIGEEFETAVSLSNPGKKGFQTIEVSLRFDPTVLEPVRLDDDQIRPLLEGPAESVVYTDAGLLVYRARTAKLSSAQAAEFFTVRWKALATDPLGDITFGTWGRQRTALLDEADENILGGALNTGALSMTFQVFSPTELADGPTIGDELFAGQREATRGGIRLRLVTNRTRIPANEDFYVGIWFENPRLLEVSKVSLKIHFDPNILEVVDDDTNNWVTRGINIFDGDYHDQFPFDILLQDSASNDSGLINYAMACAEKRVLPQAAYLARIRFRPKAQADSARIWLDLAPEDDPLRTQVCFLGSNLLGKPSRGDTGVENLTVSIGEPQLPRLLATENNHNSQR